MTIHTKILTSSFDLAHTDSQSYRHFLPQDAPFRHLLHHPHPIYLFATHRQIPLHPHAPFHAKGTLLLWANTWDTQIEVDATTG